MSGVFKDSVRSFLKPIEKLLDDDSISEIMINGPKEIYIERAGKIEKTNCEFKDEENLLAAVRNIAQSVGRQINDDFPKLDARLPDGSRIHALIPPMARNGTTMAIRKFFKSTMTMKSLLDYDSISIDAAKFLDVCVFLGKNILISGGTGSGKTSLLNVLAGRIPKNQRVIVIEDSTELQIDLPHCVFFETRHADREGRGLISIRDLLHSSLRLRPDRIIVGEVRGSEAMDLISAMNTGHGGSMGTVHSNSPADCLVRLETLALMESTTIPVEAVRKQIVSAIQIVLQVKRFPDGSRKITHISETLPLDAKGDYHTRDIYKYVQTGVSKEGKIQGSIEPCNLPTFFSEIEYNHIPLTRDHFSKQKKAA